MVELLCNIHGEFQIACNRRIHQFIYHLNSRSFCLVSSLSVRPAFSPCLLVLAQKCLQNKQCMRRRKYRLEQVASIKSVFLLSQTTYVNTRGVIAACHIHMFVRQVHQVLVARINSNMYVYTNIYVQQINIDADDDVQWRLFYICSLNIYYQSPQYSQKSLIHRIFHIVIVKLRNE